jgi:undecaprenyl-diphosphatase
MDLFLFQQMNYNMGRWPELDFIVIFFAKYFEYFVILILFLFLLERFSKYWKMVLKALIAAVLARLVFTNLIRWIFPRNRPFVDHQVNLLLSKINESSFPSGHAAFFFGLATIVFYYHRDSGILFFLFAILISLARVFAGIHWPSDIVGGAIVGIFAGWLVNALYQKYFVKRVS